jgi:hypothetical protein
MTSREGSQIFDFFEWIVLKLEPIGMTFRKNGWCEAHQREPHETDIISLIKQHVVDLEMFVFAKNLEQAKIDT